MKLAGYGLEHILFLPIGYTGAMQGLYRGYTGAIQGLYRGYTGAIQELYRGYTGAIQELNRGYTVVIQGLTKHRMATMVDIIAVNVCVTEAAAPGASTGRLVL